MSQHLAGGLLHHNLSEALSLVFEHYRAQLRSVSHALAPAPMAESERQPQQKDVPETSLSPLPIASGQPYRAPFIQQVQHARRESRLQRYQQLVALQREGMTTVQIAQQVGLSPRSIRRWLDQEHVPQGRQRRRRPSLIDPYEPYVLMRWQQGCHNGLQIWREIAARGYSGSPKAFYHYLARLRPAMDPSMKQSSPSASRKRKKPATSSGPSDPLLNRRALRLLLRGPTELTAIEEESLQLLRELHPQVETLYQLSQDFMSMLRQHQAESLDLWLVAVKGCGIPEMQRFGRGIEQDKAAVLAGLCLPYSNGVVEGHVNRLKLIKHMMYGRAKFPLLRQRVLQAA